MIIRYRLLKILITSTFSIFLTLRITYGKFIYMIIANICITCSHLSWFTITYCFVSAPSFGASYPLIFKNGQILGFSPILAKSSKRPLTFYRFSSKPKIILQFYLHPQIDRCVSQLRHWQFWQNSKHCIQDAPMNTGTPIFKIHKFQHFVTFCEKSTVEISNFHKQIHFITKAYDCRNRLMQKWTWQWSLWGKMLKLTPLLNANSC